jgi:hypothetical protein
MTTDTHHPMTCPFCGGFPVMTMGNVAWDGMKGMFQMRCQSCDARGPAKPLPLEAAKAWDKINYRRRRTDRDFDPDDDGPESSPDPVRPKTPEMAQ